MKAIIYTQYGSPDVLQYKDVEQPRLEDNRVLVKVVAASVNALDWHLMRGEPFLVRLTEGWRKPKDPRLGADLSGRVEAVGKNVTRFQVGDEVFGRGFGAFAEYVCPREDLLVKKPASMSFEAAAALPVAAGTALQGLRDKGKVQAGQHVLINGAGGGVGMFAVQFAKYFGAQVTAVCSAQNADLVRSLGADHVIDYQQDDFTKSNQRYDLILAVNGYHPLSAYRRALQPRGTMVFIGGSQKQIMRSLLWGPFHSLSLSRKKMRSVMANPTKDDLALMCTMFEAGSLRSVIDRTYPLHEVPAAIRYMEAGHVRGKVIINVEQ